MPKFTSFCSSFGTIGASHQMSAAPNSISFTTPGTYSWTVPAGVTSVSIVAVGGGMAGPGGVKTNTGISGQGGSLAYNNNIPVTPGQVYTVVVGAGGTGPTGSITYNWGGDSYVQLNSTYYTYATGGNYNTPSAPATYGSQVMYFGGGSGGGLGAGGLGGCNYGYGLGGAGGAGGYTAAGGQGGTGTYGSNSTSENGIAATGGGGGGSPGQYSHTGSGTMFGVGGGGGVSIFGLGANGAGGVYNSTAGGGGSGGTSGSTTANANGGAGGNYGGGGGPGAGPSATGGNGGGGAVRIVWPGSSRQFPSTNVGLP